LAPKIKERDRKYGRINMKKAKRKLETDLREKQKEICENWGR